MSLESNIVRFRLKAMEATEEVIKQSLFDLFSSIILQTPVDKGFLRNSWNVSFEGFSTEIPTRPAPVGTATINRVKLLLNTTYTKDTQAVYFSSNLPYVNRIEFDGHSAQAPNGMVRINTIRWETIVENNRREFKV